MTAREPVPSNTIRPSPGKWRLWVHQIAVILRLEIRKNFLAKRGLWIYLLALAPVAVIAAHAITTLVHHRQCDFAEDSKIYAGIFQFFYLRLGIFFGCVGIFMNLFRGEVLEKSLHYYFLAPVRREVLVIGKYLAGVIVVTLIFCTATLLAWWAMYLNFDSNVIQDYVWKGPGLELIGAYVGVTALACVGYGAIFLFMGLLFRNPLIPAGIVLVWDWINPFLPSLLKKCSVIFYLKSLCPVDVPVHGALAIIATNTEPAPVPIAILGLLGLTLALVIASTMQIRKMEISYGAE
jgi:ABC-type transport system involved in multi-copper enzyme maturation permease subunit